MESRIVLDPEVRHGRPVIRGTRVPIVRILAELGGGMPEEQIAAEYDLSVADVRAVCRYAVELVERDRRSPSSARS